MRYRPPKPSEQTDEPLSVDYTVVSEYLERMRKPRMASLVRSLGQADQAAGRRAMDLVARCNELHRRLERYEPPADNTPYDPTPPPEASD